jgi:hypothetical protein
MLQLYTHSFENKRLLLVSRAVKLSIYYMLSHLTKGSMLLIGPLGILSQYPDPRNQTGCMGLVVLILFCSMSPLT